MNFDELKEDNIQALIDQPKRVTNPQAKWRDKPGHRQQSFKVKSDEYDFELYLRQSMADTADFSCGLLVYKPDGQPLTLLRYNGASHPHGDIFFACHIHRTTERAMRAGRKPESEAQETDRYRTLEGAVYCLLEDAKISGVSGFSPDQPQLFPE